ncbi:unannotated protein [freshwater metagenome]|uniref:Unannotated protein n=1 Tax=freshwater metagenome TaxID=449393 RepID=A0A6J7T5E6_9ZZZZ
MAAVVTPPIPEEPARVFVKIKPAPRKPIPVITACKARVGSPYWASTSMTAPMATITADAAHTKAIVRGPADLPARSRSQPISEPRIAAITASIMTTACCHKSTECISIMDR